MTAKNTSKKQTTLTITVILAVILFYGLALALWSVTLGLPPDAENLYAE
ncbi:MAG: hypothetical protein K2L05_04945 [Muribaculaceae bacterium]|nr:hypothetical protein [Muribaculaceae bacterium]